MKEHGDGRHVILATDDREHRLTAEQFLAAVDANRRRQRDTGWRLVVLKFTTWAGVLWVALGVAGQSPSPAAC